MCSACRGKTEQAGGAVTKVRHALDGVLSDHELEVEGGYSLEGALRLNEETVKDILRRDLAAKR